MYKVYQQYLSQLHATGKYRQLPVPDFSKKKCMINFSTNDYLNFSAHPKIIKAAIDAAHQYGVGATGARLLSGNSALFEELESKIAKDKKTQAALVFNSGFQTNVSVLSSLLDSKVLNQKPLVFFDKLNHSSLYQAVFLSGAQLIRYNHNDMNQLSTFLKKYENENRPKFIVCETIFGMDGDLLPIHDVTALAEQYNAFLYLDEAHATGVVGSHGYGLSTMVNLQNIPHLIMGTFSKALGCSGGYIACDTLIKEYLINKSSGFIYSTANSPMVIGAANKAWDLVKTLDAQRANLIALSATLRNKLVDLGFDIGQSCSHIIPIVLKTESRAMQVKEKLLEEGIMVSCIRPPTVPPHTSRIRIALNTNHTLENIKNFIQVIKKI